MLLSLDFQKVTGVGNSEFWGKRSTGLGAG